MGPTTKKVLSLIAAARQLERDVIILNEAHARGVSVKRDEAGQHRFVDPCGTVWTRSNRWTNNSGEWASQCDEAFFEAFSDTLKRNNR